jgi:hypothetical protein
LTPVFIKSIELWNVKAFEHLRADLGQVTVVRGTNAAGKTSFSKGLSMFFEAGSDPAIIRRGATEAKGLIEFSNGYTATKVTTRDGATLTVRNPEGGVCAAPASLIEKLLPRNSFDCSVFLDDFDIKKRTDFILEHLPITFSIEEINEALQTKYGLLGAAPPVPLLGDGEDKSLEDFDKLFNEADTARAAINREIENLKGAAATLADSLPNDTETDWSTAADDLQSSLNAIDQGLATSEADIKLEAEQARSDKNSTLGAQITDAKVVITSYTTKVQGFAERATAFANSSSQVVSACEALRADAELIQNTTEDFITAVKGVKRLEAELVTVLEKITWTENEAIAEEKAKKSEQRAKLAESLGEARAKAVQQQQGQGVKDALAKARTALKGETVRYEHIAAVLEALKRLKAGKMRTVDIEGFDIKFEKAKGARKESAVILIDGLPLDELNRAKALFVALKLVVLAQKANSSDEQLPLVIMETAELVESNREQLWDAVQDAGMQLVITVPEDGAALTVEAMA